MQKIKGHKKLQAAIIILILFVFSLTVFLLVYEHRQKEDVFIAPVEEPKNIQELLSRSASTTTQTDLQNNSETENLSSVSGESKMPASDSAEHQQSGTNDNRSGVQYYEQRTENLSFHLLRAYKTNRLPDKDPDKVIYWNEAHTSDGTLTDYTYIFIDVKIKNLDNTTREIYLNSCNELYIENNVMMPIEMRYRKDGGDANSKGYFRDTLKAGEEKTYTLGYIIDNENADKSLTLRHNPLGRLYDDSIRQYEIFPEKVN